MEEINWEEKYHQAVEQHEKEVAALKFDHLLRDAITARGGRSEKAIAAMLDLESLQTAQDQQQAVDTALEQLQKDSGWLFAPGAPAYAPGTGTRDAAPRQVGSLAEALRERFERK